MKFEVLHGVAPYPGHRTLDDAQGFAEGLPAVREAKGTRLRCGCVDLYGRIKLGELLLLKNPRCKFRHRHGSKR